MRNLARELQQLVVQQEEAREPQAVDHAQLLLQARLRLPAVLDGHPCDATPRQRQRHRSAPQPTRARRPRNAPPRRRLAQLDQPPQRSRVLGSRVAVAQVPAQIEAQLLAEEERLAHRLWMIGEAAGHRLRSAQHVAVISAAQGL